MVTVTWGGKLELHLLGRHEVGEVVGRGDQAVGLPVADVHPPWGRVQEEHITDFTLQQCTLKHCDNVWKSRGGNMVNEVPREVLRPNLRVRRPQGFLAEEFPGGLHSS